VNLLCLKGEVCAAQTGRLRWVNGDGGLCCLEEKELGGESERGWAGRDVMGEEGWVSGWGLA